MYLSLGMEGKVQRAAAIMMLIACQRAAQVSRQSVQQGPRKEEIMHMRYTSMALCLMLVLSWSARHTHGATTTPVMPSKTVSLDVQDADVRDVLRLLADTGGINILTSGEVQGTVTTRLLDVPWEQALAAILHLTGLAQERQGN